jgi:hypothetical protein
VSAVTFKTVCQLALALPGVEEGTSYGTPALKVKGKFLSRLKEGGETIVVKVNFDVRDVLMAADPETFYITDHYRGYPAVLVRLSSVRREDLRRLLEEAWRGVAPKRLVAAFDGERGEVRRAERGRKQRPSGPGRAPRRR